MHFGASAVGADGRRRDAGDAVAHLPGAATKQMPPRRRTPSGWGPQGRCRCYSLLTYRSGYARRSRLASVPGDPSKVHRLLPDRPLDDHIVLERLCRLARLFCLNRQSMSAFG